MDPNVFDPVWALYGRAVLVLCGLGVVTLLGYAWGMHLLARSEEARWQRLIEKREI